MKSSKHVKTCFVTGNDDFDDKLTYIYCFLHEKYFLDKNPQKRTLCPGAENAPSFANSSNDYNKQPAFSPNA